MPTPKRACSVAVAEARRAPRLFSLAAPLLLVALTLLLFGDVLFSAKRIVLSQLGTDVYRYFSHARRFGFTELARGNLPLWNPHLFAGTPYLGSFQAALLYPPNGLYLLLPLHTAINADIALHVMLIGICMYAWATTRGLHPAAALVSACVLMFGGPFFLKVYAGHLATLGAMAWIPLLFLAVDRAFETRAFGGWLLGVFAVTMQILAGHPQTVFHTAVAAVLYLAIRLLHARAKLRVAVWLVGVFAGAAALSAVQLLTGLQASAESTRSAGVPYEFAATFSLPPENFLTWLTPSLFGGTTSVPYWGRSYLWEMSLFMGVTGFTLAVYGAASRAARLRGTFVAVVVALLWLALGAHTPLFAMLHAHVPGFASFRGSSKFIVQAAVFMAMLSGIGLDRLLRSPASHRALALVMVAAGLGLGGAGFWVQRAADPTSLWGRAMSAVASTDESYLVAPSTYRDPAFVHSAGIVAGDALLHAAVICIVLGVVFWSTKHSPRAVYALAALAIAEVLLFARANRPTFDLAEAELPAIGKFLAGHRGDFRVLNLTLPDAAMSVGADDLWGYDPIVLRRYAEFIAFTQKEDPDDTTMYVEFSRLHPLYRMLRLRYAFEPERGATPIAADEDPLPRLLLVDDWALVTGRDRMFAALGDPSFDPRRRVLLETTPEPPPERGSGAGTVRLVASSTDELTVEADLPRPEILLITDAYSSEWRAVALPGSVQTEYAVLPADWVLRAIALRGGKHRLRIEYAPAAFRIGKWISIVAIAVYALLLGRYWMSRRTAA